MIDIDMVLRIASLPAIGSSVLLGLMIGAFYGFMLDPDRAPTYPFALWGVGIAFIVTLATLGHFTSSPIMLESQVARAMLWTFVCGSIPIGRYGRHVAAIHGIRRKRWRLETREETAIEKQDREVGDERRDRQDRDGT